GGGRGIERRGRRAAGGVRGRGRGARAGRGGRLMAAERPALSWSDVRGMRAGIWGLGVEGRASLRKLTELGVDPVLVDDRPSAPEPGGRPVLATAGGGLDALRACDVVIKSPGISRYRAEVTDLAARGVAVAGGLGRWAAGAGRGRGRRRHRGEGQNQPTPDRREP